MRTCVALQAVLTSKCYGTLKNTDCIAAPTSSSTCPMKSPDFCPEAVPQLRVTKGMMWRDYNSVRVSLITPSEKLAPVKGFDYNEPFRHKWQHVALSSKLLTLPAAGTPFDMPFTWLHGPANASVRLPRKGEGTAGLMIADP